MLKMKIGITLVTVRFFYELFCQKVGVKHGEVDRIQLRIGNTVALHEALQNTCHIFLNKDLMKSHAYAVTTQRI